MRQNQNPYSPNLINYLQSGFQLALLHHSRKEQAVTDGICYKIDI
ncbi:hypothetical protein [Wolbachia endosymbiont of Kerria lacca]